MLIMQLLPFVLPSYANTPEKSQLNSMTLAGFKIHTTVIKPDKQGINELNTNSASTIPSNIENRKVVSKTRIDNKSNNVIDTKKTDKIVLQESKKQNNITSNKLALRPKYDKPNSSTVIRNTSTAPIHTLAAHKDVKATMSTTNNDNKQSSNNFLQENKNSLLSENNLQNENLPANYEKEKLNISDYDAPLSNKVKDVDSIKEPDFMSLVSSLFIVIILVLIFGWLYTKLRGVDPAALLSGKLSSGLNNKFSLLSSTTLGQGKSIHLVEIKGKQLVIGSTNNNINLLTELNDQIESEQPVIQEENDSKFQDTEGFNSSHFPDIYKEYLENRKNTDD